MFTTFATKADLHVLQAQIATSAEQIATRFEVTQTSIVELGEYLERQTRVVMISLTGVMLTLSGLLLAAANYGGTAH